MIETKDKELSEEQQKLLKEEKNRLLVNLTRKTPHMIVQYKSSIKRTGGLLQASMTYAYERGILDAIKTITKDEK